MPTIAEFRANPLFEAFPESKFRDAIVGEFLELSVAQLEGDRECLEAYFDRCCYLLAAHRLTKWNAAGASNTNSVSELSLAEMRDVVSSLSVSDEAGSESVSFRQAEGNSGKYDPDDLASTAYGKLYQALYSRFKCNRSWGVT